MCESGGGDDDACVSEREIDRIVFFFSFFKCSSEKFVIFFIE